MKRAIALLLMGALWVALSTSLAPAAPTGVRSNTFHYDRDVMEALRLIDDGRYVKARERAEVIFNEAPESYQSWYLMGLAIQRSESNLPRAWFYMNGARERIEREYGGEYIPEDGPWTLHGQILRHLADITGEMDQPEEQLKVLASYDRLYGATLAPLTVLYGWPLMKLGRYDEARQKLEQAMRERPYSEDTIENGLNTLGAIESELDHPDRAYDIFMRLVDVVKQRHWRMEAVYPYNAAESALTLLKFNDVERLLLESSVYFEPSSYTNPYELLSTMYIGEGRLTEAITGVRHMHDWAHASEPSIEQQHWNDEQQTTAAALLAAGYDQDAIALMRRTLNRPDRRGSISTSMDKTEICTLLFYRELLKMERERYAEHLSWCTWQDWFVLQAAKLENERELWSTTSRIASVILGNDRIDWTLRPYAIDGYRLLEWYRPALHEVLGEGVVSVAVKRLLERQDEVGLRERPYLLAALGEADAARGFPARAIENLTAALRSLPTAEVLLRSRVVGLLAQCYARQGDTPQSLACLRQVMEKDPHVVRALDLALPVTLETDGSPAATIAASMLRHSPRFEVTGSGFTIRLASTVAGLAASLLFPDNTVFCTASVPNGDSTRETARALCQDFHNHAFMPRLDLSQTDINSLDGSNETGQTNRIELLKVFGVSEPPSAP